MVLYKIGICCFSASERSNKYVKNKGLLVENQEKILTIQPNVLLKYNHHYDLIKKSWYDLIELKKCWLGALLNNRGQMGSTFLHTNIVKSHFHFFVFLFTVFRTCLSACPTDVQTYANGCVVEYNAQLKHIEEHDRQFFSGVDVENLRSLCR